MSSSPILETVHLSKRFKKRWAVKDLNLSVHSGDVFGFLGPNGAGKSTTIRMILTLIFPTEGHVRLFGRSVVDTRAFALKRVGGIVEKPDFYPYLSAHRNLQIVGALNGGARGSRIEEVLELVGLKDRAHDPVKTYSHGMRQRLGIAQALLHDPEMIILDEPTSGLDPQGMKEVRELILHLSRGRGKTVFLSSHLLHEIEMVANRMAIINRGELVIQGGVEELLSKGESYVVLKAEPAEAVRRTLGMLHRPVSFQESDEGFRLEIEPSEVPALTEKLVQNNVRVHAIVPRRSLEDYFLSLTESETPHIP
jgi:ABC-2 type transport system ATP-binding protein